MQDPQFTCKISQAESNSEGNAKKIMWGKTGQRTRSKKYPHHRSHGGYAQRDRHGANYPFAMQRDLTATNVKKGQGQRQQKKAIEEEDCRELQRAANWAPAHGQCRESDY